MPFGLWKSKWEIHREESARLDAEHRERMERFSEEMREERAAAEGRWLQLGEETSELRAKYDRELAETRRFHREMLAQLDKTYTNLTATMQLVVDELHELKLTVRAQTEAIMKLVDRFEAWERRWPDGP